MSDPESAPLIPLDAEDHRCVHCGYDLRGITEKKCPECGERFYVFDVELRRDERAIKERIRRNRPPLVYFAPIFLSFAWYQIAAHLQQGPQLIAIAAMLLGFGAVFAHSIGKIYRHAWLKRVGTALAAISILTLAVCLSITLASL